MFAALALAAVMAQEAPADQAFEFRGVTSTLTRQEAQQRRLIDTRHGCLNTTWDRRPIHRCDASGELERPGIAGRQVRMMSISFTPEGQFALFDIKTYRGAVPDVLAALTAKFGEPCEREVGVLQNAFGGQMPQEVTTWCLSDGRLQLVSVWPTNIEWAQVVFVADAFAGLPPPAPRVDF